MPKVSVIMPAYNAENYIAEAIDSILAQTFRDFELIVLDDCSTDNTSRIILNYEDSRLIYLKNEKNMGVAATLNRGLETARGMYIARMDADDIAMPDRLARQVAVMDEKGNIIACGSNAILFGEVPEGSKTDMPLEDKEIRLRMAISNPFVHPTMMLRKEAVGETRYDSSFDGREDYRMWMVLSQKGQMMNLPETLLRYRIHKGQVTQSVDVTKEQKHYRLKKMYFRELDIGLTEEMQEALCQAAYYGMVTDQSMAEPLKLGLTVIAKYYGCTDLPREYRWRLWEGVRKMPRSFRWRLSRGMSLKSRLRLLR